MAPKKAQARGRRVEHILQPKVTDNLQALYNNWRDTERAGSDTKVRTPSCDRRWGRANEANARRAFKRNLGACVKCRKRKVLCNHWALSDLEDAYRVLVKMRSEEDPRDPVVTSDEAEVEEGEPYESELEDQSESPTAEAQPLPTSPLPQPPELSKMEGFPPTTPPESVSNLAEDQEKPEVATAHRIIEMEDSQNPPLESPEQSSSALAAPFNPTPNYHQNPFPFPGPDLFTVQGEFAIGLGRQLAPFSLPWECIFAAGNPPRFCGVQFFTQSDLLRHFCEDHHPIKHETVMAFYVCRRCQMWNDVYGHCLQCGWVNAFEMELWLCGYPQEENVDNTGSGSLLPTSGSSGSMTEGRSMEDDEDVRFEAENERMVAEAMSVVHQSQHGFPTMGHLFSQPAIPRSEQFQRPSQTPPANAGITLDMTHFIATPEQPAGDRGVWNRGTGTMPWPSEQDDPFS